MAEREEIVFAPCSLNWRLSPFVDIGVGVNGADLLRVGFALYSKKVVHAAVGDQLIMHRRNTGVESCGATFDREFIDAGLSADPRGLSPIDARGNSLRPQISL